MVTDRLMGEANGSMWPDCHRQPGESIGESGVQGETIFWG